MRLWLPSNLPPSSQCCPRNRCRLPSSKVFLRHHCQLWAFASPPLPGWRRRAGRPGCAGRHLQGVRQAQWLLSLSVQLAKEIMSSWRCSLTVCGSNLPAGCPGSKRAGCVGGGCRGSCGGSSCEQRGVQATARCCCSSVCGGLGGCGSGSIGRHTGCGEAGTGGLPGVDAHGGVSRVALDAPLALGAETVEAGPAGDLHITQVVVLTQVPAVTA